MTCIYKDFADGIHRLNQKTAAQSTVTYAGPLGQAPYAGPIHLSVIGENLSRHKMHMQNIRDNVDPGGTYAGAAGFVNMGYIARAKSSAAILFDINTYQTAFWNLTLQKLAEHEKPSAFRESFTSIARDIDMVAKEIYPRALREIFEEKCGSFNTAVFKYPHARDLSHWVHAGSKNSPDGEWMYDDGQYAHIHEMAKTNAIGAVTLDVSSAAACAAVKDYLDNKDTAISLMYVSNIFNFMQPHVRLKDFIGRKLALDSKANAQANLYGWMEQSGKIIECDNLERGTPLIVSAGQFKPSAMAS